MRRTGTIAVVLLVLLTIGGAIYWTYLRDPVRDLPQLSIDPVDAPLIYFENSSQLDPGMVRMLIKVDRPLLQPYRRDLSRSVTAAFESEEDRPRREVVAFAELWQHENVIEVRIPLVDRKEQNELIRCRLGPDDEGFRVRPADLPSSPVGVRQVSVPEGGSDGWVSIVNRTGSALDIEGVRINGRPAAQESPIQLAAYGHARLRVGGIASADDNMSVVLSQGGQWIQAHEVARTPEFAFVDWDDPASVARYGGTMAETAVDVCSIEVERAMPAGTFLADMKRLIAEALDDQPDRQRRPHAFVFLNDGGRPVTHYIYGRLSDFVGVAALDPRLSNADLRDVAFWLRLDREIVEPRPLLVFPGVLQRRSPTGDQLDERDLRRLVLAALSVGPSALVNYWPSDDPYVVSAEDRPGYVEAMSAIRKELEPLLPLLGTALPVGWVYGESGSARAPDTYGTTGFAALWTADDRLILINLGYREQAWLGLPDGVRIGERLFGLLEVVAESDSGLLAIRSPLLGEPGIAAFGLSVDRIEDGELAWLSY